MDNSIKSPVIISLCTGMRGLERGIERVIGPLTVAAYVEIEAFIIFNLVRQMEIGMVDAAPVWTDLKTFPSRPFHNKVHIITGGYPCQPFSVAGSLAGTEDPRHLYPYIAGLIRDIQPPVVFFENVANHLNIGYREVRQSLEEMGYAVKEGIYTAQEVGAPHLRTRLFILGIRRTVDDTYCKPVRSDIGRFHDKAASTGTELGNTGLQRSQEYEKQTARFEQSGGELADTEDCDRGLPICTGKQAKGDDAARRSKELADTNSDGPGNGTGCAGSEGQTVEGTQQRQRRNEIFREWLRSLFGECCETVADTSGAGLQGQRLRSISTQPSYTDTAHRSNHKWPAGPGPHQHPWEEPRTVEPGVGCTVDGYNFRTDLLRMYGNGVVLQTSELAFRDLLNQHFEEHLKDLELL